MKTKLINVIVASLLFMSISGMVHAETANEAWTSLLANKHRKNPEFAFVQNNAALPNVLIYGDSISIGYTLQVRENLKNKANVYRIYCNGGDSGKVIPFTTKMQNKMAPYWHFQWDVIHFNVGLHDLKYLNENGKYDTKKGKQVHTTDEYKKSLKQIIEYFKKLAPEAKIIFATTTPVPQHSGGRIAGDAVKFNKAALEVLQDYPEIGINDLYELTQPNQTNWWMSPGNVHYNDLGTMAQGDKVASDILLALEQKAKAIGSECGLDGR